MNTYQIRIQHKTLDVTFQFYGMSRAYADDVCNSLDVLLNPHDIPGKLPVRVELVVPPSPHDTKHAMLRPEMPTATAVEPTPELFEPFVMTNLNNLAGAIDKLQNRLDHLTKDHETLRAETANKIEAIGSWCNNLEHAAKEDRGAQSGFARTTRELTNEHETKLQAAQRAFTDISMRLDNLEGAVSASREPRSTITDQLREMLNTIERNG